MVCKSQSQQVQINCTDKMAKTGKTSQKSKLTEFNEIYMAACKRSNRLKNEVNFTKFKP